MSEYAIFDGVGKATRRYPIDNLTWYFIIENIDKVSKSIRAYTYLVLTSYVQIRLSIAGKLASAVKFNALINQVYSSGADIDRYQSLQEHALSKINFSVGTGVYMLPSDLNFSIGKTAG